MACVKKKRSIGSWNPILPSGSSYYGRHQNENTGVFGPRLPGTEAYAVPSEISLFEKLERMVRYRIVIDAFLDPGYVVDDQICFDGVPRPCRWTRLVKQLTELFRLIR